MQQVEVLTDDVDDVPELPSLIRENLRDLQVAVAIHSLDVIQSVPLIVAQVDFHAQDPFQESVEVAGDRDVFVHVVLCYLLREREWRNPLSLERLFSEKFPGFAPSTSRLSRKKVQEYQIFLQILLLLYCILNR